LSHEATPYFCFATNKLVYLLNCYGEKRFYSRLRRRGKKRDVLETILTSAGYKVDLAKTGEEIVQAYKGKTHVGRPD
jgi:hypothetical protein